MRIILIFFMLLLVVMSACSKTEEYHRIFRGESSHWKAEIIQDGILTYKDHEKLENHYELSYSKDERITLTFKGNKEGLGEKVDFYYIQSRKRFAEPLSVYLDGKWPSNEFTFTTSHIVPSTHMSKEIPLFPPVNKKEDTLDIQVKWGDGNEEAIKLSFDQEF